MPIVVECPKCLTPLQADDRMIGEMTACPRCGTKVAIEPPAKPPQSAPASGTEISAVAGVVIVLAAAMMVVVVLAIGVGAFFFARTTAVTTYGPPIATTTVQVAPTAVGPANAGGSIYDAPAIDADGMVYFPMPANPQRVTVRFPSMPAAFDPLQDPQYSGDGSAFARQFATVFGGAGPSDWYRATSEELTFTAAVGELTVGTEANDAFFEVVGATIEGMHPGYSKASESMLMLKAPTSASLPYSDFPGRQYRLESETGVRIVRMVPIDRVVAWLTVAGPKELADDAAAASAFLDSLGVDGDSIRVDSIRPVDAEVATPPAESPAG